MSTSIPMYSLYGHIVSATELRFVHLETLESRNRIYDWHRRPHRHHDLHQLIWVNDGSGVVTIDERRLALQSPVLLSIPPPVVHGFQWRPGTDGLVLTIAESFLGDLTGQMEDDLLGDTLGQLLITNIRQKSDNYKSIKNHFDSIFDEYINERLCRSTAIAARLLMLLAELTRLRSQSLQKSLSPDPGRQALLRQFKELIETNFNKQWKVSDYADALAMTERSLRRLCQELTNQAPVQIVHQRLHLEAKRALLYTDKTVAEIAYDLGFTDHTYFARFFTRNAGVSPTTYRRQRRGPGSMV